MLDGVFWLTAAKVVGQAVSWTITIFVMRILSPNDYGLMAMAGVYLAFIVLFNEVGLSAAIIQKKDLSDEDRSNICWAVLAFNLVLFGVSFAVAPLVARFYEESRVADLIRVASLAFIIRGIGLVPNSMLTRQMAFKRQSQAALIGSTLGAAATLFLALKGFGVWSLVLGSLINEMAVNTLVYVFHPWRPTLSFSPARARTLIGFGSKVAVARILWYLSSNLDLLIAGKVLGKTQLGYYAVAVQLALVPIDKMVSTIAQVAFPAFSKVQDDPALLQRYFLKTVNVVAFASFPLCWGFFLIADTVVPLVLSDKWLPAVLPLQILSMVTSFRAIHLVNAPLELAVGRPGVTIRNFAIITSVLGLSFLVGVSYGLEGLAYSWLAFPVVFLVTTSITLRLIGLSLGAYVKELRHPLLATAFMVLSVLLVQETALADHGLLAQTTGSVALGVLCYIAYYVVFSREMFAEARNLLKR